MKRIVASTLLGLAMTAAHGQGIFIFNNYAAPFVPIVYDAAVPSVGGNEVGAGEGVIIEVWWAFGSGQPESALAFEGAIASFSASAGYTDLYQVFTIPGSDGDVTYTAQLRAAGLAEGLAVDTQRSRGPLVDVEVIDIQHEPPLLPTFTYAPGFTVFVPEPSAFALAGLGASALLSFRRRK